MHTICHFAWLHHKQYKINLKSNLQQSFLLLLAESTYTLSGSEATPVTAHPPTHALTGLATTGIHVPKLEMQFIFSDSNTGLRAVLLSPRLTAGTPKDGERWLGGLCCRSGGTSGSSWMDPHCLEIVLSSHPAFAAGADYHYQLFKLNEDCYCEFCQDTTHISSVFLRHSSVAGRHWHTCCLRYNIWKPAATFS